MKYPVGTKVKAILKEKTKSKYYYYNGIQCGDLYDCETRIIKPAFEITGIVIERKINKITSNRKVRCILTDDGKIYRLNKVKIIEHLNDNFMKITSEELKQLIEIKSKLVQLCENWASKNLEEWQHYCGFDIVSDTVIYINYSYTDYINNTDMCTESGHIRIIIDDLNNIEKYEQ